MAKRKKSKADRRDRVLKKKDRALLREYARHVYAKAREERANEDGLPLDAIVVKDGGRHQDAIKAAHGVIVQWFNALDPFHKGRARAKMESEIESAADRFVAGLSQTLEERSEEFLDKLAGAKP
jgi:hypothetical protein